MLTILTMKIERMEPMARQDHWLKLHLSDGSVIKAPDYVVADLSLFPGRELDEADLEQIHLAVGKASAKARAVRIISSAGVSKDELRHRLVQKGETVENAEEAVDWLTELKLLDDGETARQLVGSAVRKGYGKARIRQILYEKRIPKEFWEDALSQVPEMDDAVDSFLHKRFAGKQPDEKEIKRAADALLRRGHSWSDIRAGLQRYSADLQMQWEEPNE